MKKFVIQFVLLIIVITFGLFVFTNKITNIPFFPQQAKFGEITINQAKIKVEIADSQAKRSKGLGGRASLPEDEGMLFIFQSEDRFPFWMKGVNFPLDFIWIKGSQVVDLSENIPPADPGVKDETLPIYTPKVAVDKVLEVKAGTVARLQIKVGDEVKLPQ